MTLKEKIRENLKKAMKESRTTEVSVLRLVNAALLSKEKEKRYKLKARQDPELTDEEVIEAIISEAKKRKEAIVEFEKGRRNDLVKKEKDELEVLQKYLPEQIPVDKG